MPKRVLIADDNETVRRVIQSAIEEEHPEIYVCGLTADGVETIDTAMALRPDLVILDLQMPGLNGIEVAAAIKGNLPQTRTVLFTMYADACRRIAPSVGANALIDKVEGLPALLKTVKRLLSNRVSQVQNSFAQAVRTRQIEARHLESLTEQLAAPLTRCSAELKYLWVNEQYANWLHKPADKIVGRSIFDVIGKEAFSSLRHRFDQALNGEDVTYEADANYDLIGQRRICATYKPTLNSSGQPDGWLAYVEDVTEAKGDPGEGEVAA